MSSILRRSQKESSHQSSSPLTRAHARSRAREFAQIKSRPFECLNTLRNEDRQRIYKYERRVECVRGVRRVCGEGGELIDRSLPTIWLNRFRAYDEPAAGVGGAGVVVEVVVALVLAARSRLLLFEPRRTAMRANGEMAG